MEAAEIHVLPQAAADVSSDVSETSGDTQRAPQRLFALKHADVFVVADGHGDIFGDGDGLFRADTRALSRFRLTLAGRTPSLLGADVSQDNVLFTAHMTNRPLPPLGGQSMPEGVIHIERQRVLWQGRLLERLTLTNFASVPATVPLELSFASDFADIFEVRGAHRAARGKMSAPEIGAEAVVLPYRGLDGVDRRSVISFSEPPDHIDGGCATFRLRLRREEVRVLYVEVGENLPAEIPGRASYRATCARARVDMRKARRRGATVWSSNQVFNEWLDKSRADLALLTTELPTGPYPYAGIPWFSTPFGRDGIVTALQMLWLDPSLARGVLSFLAANQATQNSAFRDSAPGKIMHETRQGEMVAMKEVPFGLYYGGVDTTPLFVVLAGAYADRTGDFAFIDGIWQELERAARWIGADGDSNGDGFVDYARGADTGLANQGWKDSNDSVFHRDGSDPSGPIALVEVQGYAYAAFTAMAVLTERRGDAQGAADWTARAAEMKRATEAKFWVGDEAFYALALDGAGERCEVRTSNAGHLLYCGLPSPERAKHVIADLLAPRFSRGWGVRTLASTEARYNPMSYHNGSVWPHDTAIAAAGMARYGERDGVVRIISEMYEAAIRFHMRLPELYCGFARHGVGGAPVGYPVACAPQAWASGSVFMLLQACLGVTIDSKKGEVRIDKPCLPHGVDHLEIRNIAIGEKKIALTFQRMGKGVVVYSDQHFSGAVPIVQQV